MYQTPPSLPQLAAQSQQHQKSPISTNKMAPTVQQPVASAPAAQANKKAEVKKQQPAAAEAPAAAPPAKAVKKQQQQNGGATKETKAKTETAAPAEQNGEGAPASLNAEEDVNARFASLQEKLAGAMTVVKEVSTMLKTLQKEHIKLMKTKSKGSGKGKGKKAPALDENGNPLPSKPRVASGFAKPALLSDDMCAFLGKGKGTELARTDVTRLLNMYIKEHKLQDTQDKRTINPDAKLKAILAPTDGKYTYFNLQSHIKHHFLK